MYTIKVFHNHVLHFNKRNKSVARESNRLHGKLLVLVSSNYRRQAKRP